MPKKNATADELIWLFHEELAGTPLRNARVAIIPIGDGNWSALTTALSEGTIPISRLQCRASRNSCGRVTA